MKMHVKCLTKLSQPCAIVILILDIIAPGFGTMCLGCFAKPDCGNAFLTGLLQSLTAFIIIGWIWSIYLGIQLVKISSMSAIDLAKFMAEQVSKGESG